MIQKVKIEKKTTLRVKKINQPSMVVPASADKKFRDQV